MPEFAIVAPDVAGADLLLGVLPPNAGAKVLILGCDKDSIESEAKVLPVPAVTALPSLPFTTPPEVLGPALEPLLSGADVVVLDSSQFARDLAGWAAAALGASLVWAVTAVRSSDGRLEADRITLGGSHTLVHVIEGRPAFILSKGSHLASARSQPAGTVVVEIVETEAARSRTRVIERRVGSEGMVPLQGARLVVSIGRGIGGPENVPLFRELADTLGAALGASRVVVDAGWVPFAHQVGQTGSAVSADLYLAFGISGAIQHLAGMRSSSTIVAVNTDKEAPICQLADLVVQADAVDVAKRLLERIRG